MKDKEMYEKDILNFQKLAETLNEYVDLKIN